MIHNPKVSAYASEHQYIYAHEYQFLADDNDFTLTYRINNLVCVFKHQQITMLLLSNINDFLWLCKFEVGFLSLLQTFYAML